MRKKGSYTSGREKITESKICLLKGEIELNTRSGIEGKQKGRSVNRRQRGNTAVDQKREGGGERGGQGSFLGQNRRG